MSDGVWHEDSVFSFADFTWRLFVSPLFHHVGFNNLNHSLTVGEMFGCCLSHAVKPFDAYSADGADWLVRAYWSVITKVHVPPQLLLPSLSPLFPSCLSLSFILDSLIRLPPSLWAKVDDRHTHTHQHLHTHTHKHTYCTSPHTHTFNSGLLCVSDCSLLRGCGRLDDVELLWRFSVAAATLSQQPMAMWRGEMGKLTHQHALNYTQTHVYCQSIHGGAWQCEQALR